jgi:hypothetical protein
MPAGGFLISWATAAAISPRRQAVAQALAFLELLDASGREEHRRADRQPLAVADERQRVASTLSEGVSRSSARLGRNASS